jgi:hypothetical protein
MFKVAFALLAWLVLIELAKADERTRCSAEPNWSDGQAWHYRTKIPGYAAGVRDDKCWYVGESMKPRSELYWEQSAVSPLTAAPGLSGQRGEVVSTLAPAPAFTNKWPAEGSFADRWEGIGTWAWK